MESGWPRFREFAKLAWAVWYGDERKWREMGAVRGELLRVVRSPLSDDEAARRISDLAQSDPKAAKATLRYVSRALGQTRTYETDRACRVLVAAMRGQPPEPVRSEDLSLFERERELVLMPLDVAFDQLVLAVPGLEAVRDRAQRLAHAPGAVLVERQSDRDQIVVSGELYSEVMDDAERLVGPRSRQRDPLMRSSLTRRVVGGYVTAVLAGPDAALAHRPLWDQQRPWPTLRWSGSFVG